MKNLRFTFGIIFSLFCSRQVSAQFADKKFYLVDSLVYNDIELIHQTLIDSTLKLYHASNNDTLKLDLLNNIIDNCWDENVWPKYNTYLKKYCNRLLFVNNGKPDSWYIKVGEMLAIATNNEGFFSYYHGDFDTSLDRFYESLSIREKINDKSGISECLNNIGGIQYSQHNYDEALKLFKQSLALKIEINEIDGIATAYNNIGAIFNDQNQTDSAEVYYLKCLDIYVDEQDELGMGLIYHNLGSIYAKNGLTEKADWFFMHSIKLNQKNGRDQLVANSYFLLSKMYFELKRDDLAEKYAKISLEYAKQIGYPEDIKDAAGVLNELYRRQRKFKEAIVMYDLYIVMKDSSFNDKIRQEVEDRDLAYNFEKKVYADSLAHADENRINTAKISERDAIIKQDEILKYSLIIGFVLLAVITLLILVSLRNKKRANEEIAKQKLQVEAQRDIIDEKHKLSVVQQKMLEEQNREIKDSITYAKRLQDAILPSTTLVKKCLPESFILYRPKDIVAGDFYWLEEVDDTVYFAAADCTGHGVPGAFVSVVCSNAMNQAILELGKCHPADLLEKVTELVVKTFEKSNHIIKDGMDIALCAWNKTTNILSYSGAYNPLWIVSKRKNLNAKTIPFAHVDDRNILHEIKATKQPVGKYTFKKAFEGHDVQLEKGDTIYLLSDGYADQFGGAKGKKFKYKQLKTLLLILSEHNIEEQKRQLNQTFEQWKGEFEQIDDVCIIGVRV